MDKIIKITNNSDLKKIKDTIPNDLKCGVCNSSINACDCIDYNYLKAFNACIKVDVGLLGIIDRIEKEEDIDSELERANYNLQYYKDLHSKINDVYEKVVKQSYNIINLHKYLSERTQKYVSLHETFIDFINESKHKISFENDNKVINHSLLKDYNLDSCFLNNMSVVISKKNDA